MSSDEKMLSEDTFVVTNTIHDVANMDSANIYITDVTFVDDKKI